MLMMLFALMLPVALAERAAHLQMSSQSHALVQVQASHGRTSITDGNEATLGFRNAAQAAETSDHPGVVDKIVFIKLYSVGGSTMTSILHNYCELHHKNCFVSPPPSTGGFVSPDVLSSIVSAFTSSDMPALDIWPNHVVMETLLFNRLIPGSFMISLVRNPLDRLMSSFRHGGLQIMLLTMNNLEQNVTTTEGPKSCGAAGTPMSLQITPDQVDDLDFVMLTEEYDLSLMMLRRALGWSMFDMMYLRLKENSDDNLITASARFAEYLSQPVGNLNAATTEFLQLCMGATETAVYVQAKSRFQKQWEDLGPAGQQEVLDDTAEFQSVRDSLEECCESERSDSYCVALLEDNSQWNQRYQDLGYEYTSMEPNGQAPEAAITLESPCRKLVEAALYEA